MPLTIESLVQQAMLAAGRRVRAEAASSAVDRLWSRA